MERGAGQGELGRAEAACGRDRSPIDAEFSFARSVAGVGDIEQAVAIHVELGAERITTGYFRAGNQG